LIDASEILDLAHRQIAELKQQVAELTAELATERASFVDPLPPVSIRHRSSGRPAAFHDDGFAERSPIFLLADRIHGPQLRQQLVDQRTQPRPRRAVRK
jgi:hypothetical protein